MSINTILNKTLVISSMDPHSMITNKPPIISINAIQRLTNIPLLRSLEQSYDTFIDTNTRALMLYNVLEDYLEIRDALTIRLLRLKREEKLRFYVGQYALEPS